MKAETRNWKLLTPLFLLTLSYAALLALVSLLPSGTAAPGGWDTFMSPTMQNCLHLPAYAILVGLVLASASGQMKTERRIAAAAIAASLAFGILLEWFQQFVPGRCASLTDLVSNAMGVAFGAIGYFACRAFRRPQVTDT